MKLLRSIFHRKSRDLPSVMDFESTEALKRALGGAGTNTQKLSGSISTLVSESNGLEELEHFSTESRVDDEVKVVDWKLPMFDAETTHVQTMEKELERLLILRSFNLLDTGREEHFDRLVKLAVEIFQAPIALINLIDLGRAKFLSSEGVGDINESPRDISICAHVVQAKTNQPLVIPDLSKDFRFKKNPLVTGPHALRFYAGAPLISPEGHKIGSFCVMDTVARPEGLSFFDEEILIDLASMTMDIMVQRRSKLLLLQRKEKNSVQTTDLLESFDRILCPVTDIHKLYQNLNTFVEPLPKNVLTTIEIDTNLPQNVECDDLLLFRSSLILLNNAVARTKSGRINFSIQANLTNETIVFECEDTGSPSIDGKKTFAPGPKSQLPVMHAMVEKMNGKHGAWTSENATSIFWFSVPLIAVATYETALEKDLAKSNEIKAPSLIVEVHSPTNISSRKGEPANMLSKKLKGTVICESCQDEIIRAIGYKPDASFTSTHNI